MTDQQTSGQWLRIVGFGEDGWSGLSDAARTLVSSADVLVAGERHFRILDESPEQAGFAPVDQERIVWESPFGAMLDRVESLKDRFASVCVLATGDPMCFGVGASLSRRVPAEEILLVPGQSAFSLMAARLCWPLMECELLTIHGRAVEQLHQKLVDGARLLLLSADEKSPAAVAEILRARGFGQSRMTVFEHMGGDDERRLDGTAEDWPHEPGASFNAIAVGCVADEDALSFSLAPGLPDDAFVHDGKMTKRIVRAATLAMLQPMPGQLLWDLGAGSGSIAIEWMRAAPRTKAVAVEREDSRLAMIGENAIRLGTPDLQIVKGSLPSVLDELTALEKIASPDAIFIGGGATADGLVERCWELLKPGGRLVANAVTLEGEAKVMEWHKTYGGELNRIAVNQASPVGPFYGWRPAMPVTQYVVNKKR
ncbi:precorrin-6y C5,15-methyltransferase (decarboxylating) subunit CbiE [Kiloniella sp. b19]|uniref:precorrin-6y C5,15-methyltransferase (decarboxylating) subunit CbiE n=1 Tax=Kiloniella sp. GXU_MW_B19 TaxID=3141326 RepID=UPI0031E3EE17